MMRWLPIIIFALLAGFLGYQVLHQEHTKNQLKIVNEVTPLLDLPIMAIAPGTAVKTKIKIVHFFASWCVPCHAEHPLLEQLQKPGVTLIGINYKDQPQKADTYLTELGNPYHIVFKDNDGTAGIDWGITGTPEIFIIDEHNMIRARFSGAITQDMITQEILPLIERLGA